MPARIEFEKQQGLARVTLSYPERFNAMSRAMWCELKVVFDSIAQDADLRCVLVTGQGAHFCAGGDISEYSGFRFQETSLRDFHELDVWSGLQAMLDCDLPIVAEIRGNCMGGGLEIACCCDIRLAASSARFGAPVARLGFPMAPREAALVAGEVGQLMARQMLLEAAVLEASDMLQRGFLTRVVADDALADHAHATVQRMMTLAPQAARLTKQTLRALNRAPAHTHQALPAMNSVAIEPLLGSAYAYADSAEHREGIAAFLEKRPPVF